MVVRCQSGRMDILKRCGNVYRVGRLRLAMCVWFLCDGHDDTADSDKRRLFFFILRALDRFSQICFMAALSLIFLSVGQA